MSELEDPWRASRLRPEDAHRVVWADLHNHSALSDGLGDPATAFAQLRAAGLDAAALTDHASIPHHRLAQLHADQYPDPAALALARSAPRSIDPAGWRRTGELADAHDRPGEFTALRGFEWTEPWLGHVNVWFSGEFLPVTTPGRLDGLHDFLRSGQPQALFGYNHPGREPGRLDGFSLPEPALAARMVALEAFNRADDFLFGGCDPGARSPLVDCLDAGWRPGLVGASDEHGRAYGLIGKGRTGLWVSQLSRTGIREALLARRSFATREIGLRLDATLDGVGMGGQLPHPVSRPELAVDLGLPGHEGMPIELQLLTGAGPEAARAPDPAHRGVRVSATVGARAGTVTRAVVDLPPGTRWVVLRVADPARGYGPGAPVPVDHPAGTRALAYASPWWVPTAVG